MSRLSRGIRCAAITLLVAVGLAASARAEVPPLLTRALAPDKLGFRAGEATLAMQLRDRGGRIVERMLRARTRVDADGRRTRLTFLEPIDQKGIELLIVEKPGRAPEQTLWLPRARELRVIAAGDRGASMQGSDFTFEDFERRDIGNAVVTELGDETLGGLACARLVATGLPSDRWASVVFWIAREAELPLRIDFLQAGDRLARRFEVKRLQKVGERLVPTRMVMSDELAGTKTTLELSGFRDESFPASLFQPDALGR